MLNISRQNSKKQVVGLLGLALLVGVTWLLGIPMFDDARLAFQYIFAILNSFQGIYIFVFQLVLRKEVRQHWQKVFRRLRRNRSHSVFSGILLRILPSALSSTLGSSATKTSTLNGSSDLSSPNVNVGSLGTQSETPLNSGILETPGHQETSFFNAQDNPAFMY